MTNTKTHNNNVKDSERAPEHEARSRRVGETYARLKSLAVQEPRDDKDVSISRNQWGTRRVELRSGFFADGPYEGLEVQLDYDDHAAEGRELISDMLLNLQGVPMEDEHGVITIGRIDAHIGEAVDYSHARGGETMQELYVLPHYFVGQWRASNAERGFPQARMDAGQCDYFDDLMDWVDERLAVPQATLSGAA